MTKLFYILYLFMLTLYVEAAPDKHKDIYAEAKLQARYLLCILQEASESSYIGEDVSQKEHALPG